LLDGYCAMWMTGFDVPSCSTIYLDKPMRNHTLMQTIARANRVFLDKTNGLIVDYVGVFRSLEKALAVYAATDGRAKDAPIKAKIELKSQLIVAIDKIKSFLKPLNVDLEKIRTTKDVFARVKLKDDAVESILVSDDTKKSFLHQADTVTTIYKAYLPDPIETETTETAYLIRKIAKHIRSLAPEVDVSDVMKKVEALLDESVKGFEIQEPEEGRKIHDLSQIDFDELKRRFTKNRKRTEIEKLKNLIELKLDEIIMQNFTRMDFRERYLKLIEEYIDGVKNLDDIFDQLIKFTLDLKEEERRYIREGLNNEEELTIFDLLTKPDIKLTKDDIKKVKRISRQLLETLKKEKLVLDWKKKQPARAAVKVTIADILDQLPNVYTPELYQQKCNLVYQYVYDMPRVYAEHRA